jgi:hypothetical protein
LKDSAVHYHRAYFVAMGPGNKATEQDIRAILNSYKYYRMACLSHFKTKRKREEFLNWMACQEKTK